MRYVKLPVIVQAVEWDGRGFAEFPKWLNRLLDSDKLTAGALLQYSDNSTLIGAGWVVKEGSKITLVSSEQFKKNYAELKGAVTCIVK